MNREIKVLDKGFIALESWMGSDADIARRARQSFNNKETKTAEEDRRLIRYLMRNSHTSPFEFAELVFYIKVPLYVWQQFLRHRTASISQVSHRYTNAGCEFHKADCWRKQSTSNKQGSDGIIEDYNRLSDNEDDLHQRSIETYDQRISFGVAREQARKDLPASLYIEAYWKMDLHNLLHFLRLRMDVHAQLEIREYANAIARIVADIFPFTWEAFNDYKLNAITLSKQEIALMRVFRTEDTDIFKRLAENFGLGKIEDGVFAFNNEGKEFAKKLDLLLN